MIVGFAEDELAQSAHEQYPAVILLPKYTETISFADPHPNVAGHQQIADAIEPSVTAHVQAHCHLQ